MPRLLEVADDGEQALDLLAGEGARRLVHHEDRGLVPEHLRDLDELGLVLADVLDGEVRVEVEAHGGQELLGLGPRARLVEEGPAARQPAGQEVLRDADGPREAELLVDHADAVALGQRGGVEGDDPAVDRDLAGVVVEGAREHLHQRGFAGAVLPDQGVDLARRCTSKLTSSTAMVPGKRLLTCLISSACPDADSLTLTLLGWGGRTRPACAHAPPRSMPCAPAGHTNGISGNPTPRRRAATPKTVTFASKNEPPDPPGRPADSLIRAGPGPRFRRVVALVFLEQRVEVVHVGIADPRGNVVRLQRREAKELLGLAQADLVEIRRKRLADRAAEEPSQVGRGDLVLCGQDFQRELLGVVPRHVADDPVDEAFLPASLRQGPDHGPGEPLHPFHRVARASSG